jgi:predicted RNase H-like HicB family nuclease
MKIYHVAVERSEGWYAASALEDPAIVTQGRTLDEVIVNVREVVELLYDEREVQVELILGPKLKVNGASPRNRKQGRVKPRTPKQTNR